MGDCLHTCRSHPHHVTPLPRLPIAMPRKDRCRQQGTVSTRLVRHWLNSSVSSQTTSDCARGLAASSRHISNKLSSCMHHNQSIPYIHTITHGRVVSRYC